MKRKLVCCMALIAALLSSMLLAVSSSASVYGADPLLQWPPVEINPTYGYMTTSPTGEMTIGCDATGTYASGDYQSLTTYDSAGAIVRQLDQSQQVDGVDNCIPYPVTGGDGVVYGFQEGTSNLLAYDGDTLLWKYVLNCPAPNPKSVTIGSDGVVYVIDGQQRVVGLDPVLAPGLTQPTIVLDAHMDVGCRNELKAYDDGLIVIKNSYSAHYYDYSGVEIGTPPIPHWRSMHIGAPVDSAGRLFIPEYSASSTPGAAYSMDVSVYNPDTDTLEWNSVVVAPDMANGTMELYPTSSGGVIVQIAGSEIVDPNEPAEAVYWIIALDRHGDELWRYDEIDHYGDEYSGTTLITPDTTGKVSLIRNLNAKDAPSVQVTEVEVRRVLDGRIVYRTRLQGDFSEPNPYSYVLSLGGSRPVSSPDVLYVPVYCVGGCMKSIPEVYPFKLPGFGMDYPRGELLGDPTTQPSKLNYVAMGDSFSSGEGVEPFISGTDEGGVNECHRSNFAYPTLLAQDPALGIDPAGINFVACSGATTADVLYGGAGEGNWEEGAQVDVLSEDVNIVTLTIGGNDVGFSEYIRGCIFFIGICGPGTMAYNAMIDGINHPAFKDNLKTTYTSVLMDAPVADVYVADYPYLAPDYVLYCDGISFTGARAIQDALNGVIHQAVNEVRAGNSRLHLVETNFAGSPFENRYACGGETPNYFNGVILPSYKYSFHPNRYGQAAYASTFREVILSN